MPTLFQLPQPLNKTPINPMLIFGIAEPGQKCKDCKFLYYCPTRPEAQACSKLTSLDPKCPGCQAKRLDECTCLKIDGL